MPHASAAPRRSRARFQLLRVVACVLAPLALPAAAEPVGSPPPPMEDHVYALAGTFACRTLQHAVTHVTGTRDGDVVTTHADVASENGAPASVDDRYTFDHAAREWKVEMGVGSPRLEFTATSGPWNGDTWTVQGDGPRGRKMLMITKLLANGDYRRIIAIRVQDEWQPQSATRCTPGTVPPPADACIVPNYPPSVLGLAVGPDLRAIPPDQPHGVVDVVVSLDEQSHVTGTRVQSSPSAYLSSAVIAAARRTTYQTEIRGCKPVAVEYTYHYVFGR